MKKKFILISIASILTLSISAQEYKVKVSEKDEPMEQGRFQPTMESLEENYTVPKWFRNAKFGIWAHWGPQCVEGSGDWMARGMYQEGSRQYKYHKEHYGHPSEVGFKDILPLFKAERWNPEKLLAFYKKIGAQYFVALGNHHDNFDLWDSKYQPWNSMKIGPKRDILGEWAAAARKVGLPFGVSLHADHAWLFYEPAQRYDRSGNKMGVPYDGTMTKADGKGKWWEGLDPQDLYRQNHPLSAGSWADGMISRQWAWGNGAATPSVDFVTNFYNRTLDVIKRYNPDLLYFDTTVLPFWPISDAGPKIAADFYNHNIATHKGKLQAVLFGKILDEKQRKAMVWDVERGAPNEIINTPWQTCSCIGNWHYNTEVYEKGSYKTALEVARMLIDIVSKNGNLLLSIPLRADGTFDEKEEAILNEFGDWMAINHEAIYSTRPWKKFGEGPIAESNIKINKEGFNEGSYLKATAEDMRFTQTPKALYVSVLAWPEDNKVTVKSLALDSGLYPEHINRVELLGYGKVNFKRTKDGLTVTLPAKKLNNIYPVLKIKR